MSGLKITKRTSDNKDELRQKAKRWDKVNSEYRQNEDGTRSSHKMSYMETDDGAVAFPTLFPKDPQKSKSHDPNDWIELSGREALNMAKERGEVYKFSSVENAKKWSDGEYKKN